jgi:2-keto-4-pentenoate hydratase/2-oxohepta-3-ene-1,7-dioic acid hydratase in catechol pathway
MYFAAYESNGLAGIAASEDGQAFFGVTEGHADYPGNIDTLLRAGANLKDFARLLRACPEVDMDEVKLLPPVQLPSKIICVGLNYADHAAETGFDMPVYPTLFARFNSSLVAHLRHIVKPTVSDQLDFEGELAVVIGTGGRKIQIKDALKHVAGYAVFNDGTIRDYQFRTPQWTMGKNFDNTGAF